MNKAPILYEPLLVFKCLSDGTPDLDEGYISSPIWAQIPTASQVIEAFYRHEWKTTEV